MKLLTIDSREVAGRPGVLLDSGWVLDLVAAPSTLSESQWVPASVISILAAGEQGRERVQRLVTAAESADAHEQERLKQSGVLLPFTKTALMPPLRRPGLILLVSAAEPVDAEPAPVTFIKSPNAAVGNDAKIAVPWSPDLGVVGCAMLGLVLGKPLYKASVREAGTAIAAVTLVMDISMPAPDAAAPAAEWRRCIQTKQFPGACPMGPVLVTRDSIPAVEDLAARILINGVQTGAGNLYSRRETPVELLAALSQGQAFRPGDLIAIEAGPDTEIGYQTLRAGDQFAVAGDQLTQLQVTVEF
jgi:2-keto-4-pentenoate hydratase/2-oxohepta-3-ene-1,7-dioic acid hydratase in catechol pathway